MDTKKKPSVIFKLDKLYDYDRIQANRMMNMKKKNAWNKIVELYNKNVPFLIRKKCIKCGECANEICLTGAVKFSPKKYPKFNLNLCNSCERCFQICNHKALFMQKAGIKGVFYFSIV